MELFGMTCGKINIPTIQSSEDEGIPLLAQMLLTKIQINLNTAFRITVPFKRFSRK